jgi:hypothetical protein
MPIVLLRNMNMAMGMVNGTWLVVQALRRYSPDSDWDTHCE